MVTVLLGSQHQDFNRDNVLEPLMKLAKCLIRGAFDIGTFSMSYGLAVGARGRFEVEPWRFRIDVSLVVHRRFRRVIRLTMGHQTSCNSSVTDCRLDQNIVFSLMFLTL